MVIAYFFPKSKECPYHFHFWIVCSETPENYAFIVPSISSHSTKSQLGKMVGNLLYAFDGGFFCPPRRVYVHSTAAWYAPYTPHRSLMLMKNHTTGKQHNTSTKCMYSFIMMLKKLCGGVIMANGIIEKRQLKLIMENIFLHLFWEKHYTQIINLI